jgi:hypothetical protein
MPQRLDSSSCKDLSAIYIDNYFDVRVASLAVLAVDAVIHRLDSLSIQFSKDQTALVQIFSPEDASLPLFTSKYWSILSSVAQALRGTCNSHAVIEYDLGHEIGGLDSDFSDELSLPSCCIKVLTISWAEDQQAAVAGACGALLETWFPRHQATFSHLNSCMSLSLLTHTDSPAVSNILSTTIFGWQEQQLAASLLKHNQMATPSASSDKQGHAGSPPATNELLIAMPFFHKVEWSSFGRSEFQGQAFVTVKSVSGIYLCIAIRSLPLVKTGSRTRGSGTPWPGRFGQAAKAARGVVGEAEDLALQRRRIKRHHTAKAAIEYAEELRRTLPVGSLVFAAIYTSELEGLQVASVKARDKKRQSALLHLLLGLPAVWPDRQSMLPQTSSHSSQRWKDNPKVKESKGRGRKRGLGQAASRNNEGYKAFISNWNTAYGISRVRLLMGHKQPPESNKTWIINATGAAALVALATVAVSCCIAYSKTSYWRSK